MAAQATLHCLTGCAIGEVLGMVISTALGWAAAPSVALAVTLAFIFGYSFTIFGLRKRGLTFAAMVKLALIADTISIAIMEITDNAFILAVPDAIHSGLDTWLFWVSLMSSLVVAFFVSWPINRWLIVKGKGHAVVHDLHNHDHNH